MQEPSTWIAMQSPVVYSFVVSRWCRLLVIHMMSGHNIHSLDVVFCRQNVFTTDNCAPYG